MLKISSQTIFFQADIYILNEYVEQQFDHLNQVSHQNGLQLPQIQSAVDHITKFLFDQVDFEAVHQEAMLK
jgi:hypothetical protein